jgi:hypothetical protein
MGLPTFHKINVVDTNIENLQRLLTRDLNLSHPVVLNLKSLHPDEQRDIIDFIENFFEINNYSSTFPYPVYILTDVTNSMTNVPTASDLKFLPKFFSQRDLKIGARETSILIKNKLLQQEIHHLDPQVGQDEIEDYRKIHRKIFELEKERKFYEHLIKRLERGKRHG